MLGSQKRETPSTRGGRPGTQRATAGARPAVQSVGADIQERIRMTAYFLYEKRGRQPGHEMSDWLEAERIVRRQNDRI
jgi:hypothetical protein